MNHTDSHQEITAVRTLRVTSQVQTKCDGGAEDADLGGNEGLLNVGVPGSDWVPDLHLYLILWETTDCSGASLCGK